MNVERTQTNPIPSVEGYPMFTKRTKLQIFVSHAQGDSDFANALRNWLDDAFLGAVKFFVSSDRGSIPLGTEWANVIRENLAQSSLMIVLVSPAGAGSRWILLEGKNSDIACCRLSFQAHKVESRRFAAESRPIEGAPSARACEGGALRNGSPSMARQ